MNDGKIKDRKIYIASDHAGFVLKQILFNKLSSLNFQVIDLGCNSKDISVDYPDYAKKLCENLNDDFGILICGSGVGVSIVANRFKNVRAALCHNPQIAELSRIHNNANVLCLGARFIDEDLALEITTKFLMTEFENEIRHKRRIEKM